MAAMDGHPLPGIGLSIREGRLFLSGPSLFSGYLGGPAHPRESHFETGDLAHLDAAGMLRIDGRVSDLIITGGENVSPLAVEAVLTRLPQVRDAMVYPVPDPIYGQRVAVAVVPEAGFCERDFLAAAAGLLAPFQRPRQVVHVEAIPRTAAGKPDRSHPSLRQATLPGLP